MDLAKACGFLAASILSLILLAEPTESKPGDCEMYRRLYCVYSLVVKGIPLKGEKENSKTYDFKINKVFRGPQNMGEVVKIDKPRLDLCDFTHHDFEKEFIVAGNFQKGIIVRVPCLLFKRWTNVAPEEEEAIKEIHRSGCKRSDNVIQVIG